VTAPKHACIESYEPDEVCNSLSTSLGKRIVEQYDLPLDTTTAVRRVAAMLQKPVGVLQVTIEPQRVWAILHNPTPVEYKIAYNTLGGFEVGDDGEVLEDDEGNPRLLPGEE